MLNTTPDKMVTVDLNRVKFMYDGLRKTIVISERDVQFDTTYEVISSKTGNTKVFDFTHSTGPEFDKNTRWVYKSDDGLLLEVCNDVDMVVKAAENYFNFKLRK